jgi:hypothetical protein
MKITKYTKITHYAFLDFSIFQKREDWTRTEEDEKDEPS